MFAALLAAAALVVLPGEEASYEALLAQQAREAAATYGGPCPEATAKRLSTEVVRIVDRPDFAAQRERVRVEGCGRSSVQNLNVGRMGGSPPWLMVAGLPGESLAEMSLQKDAWAFATAQARTDIAADCAETRVGEVYVAARPGNIDFYEDAPAADADGRFAVHLSPDLEAMRAALELDKAWVEVWPLSFCGEDRTHAIAFMPMKGAGKSVFILLPLWEQLRDHGPDALPRAE